MLDKSQIPFSEYFKLNGVSGGKKYIHSELNCRQLWIHVKKVSPYLPNSELAKCSRKWKKDQNLDKISFLTLHRCTSDQNFLQVQGLLEYDYWAENYLIFFLKNPSNERQLVFWKEKKNSMKFSWLETNSFKMANDVYKSWHSLYNCLPSGLQFLWLLSLQLKSQLSILKKGVSRELRSNLPFSGWKIQTDKKTSILVLSGTSKNKVNLKTTPRLIKFLGTLTTRRKLW